MSRKFDLPALIGITSIGWFSYLVPPDISNRLAELIRVVRTQLYVYSMSRYWFVKSINHTHRQSSGPFLRMRLLPSTHSVLPTLRRENPTTRHLISLDFSESCHFDERGARPRVGVADLSINKATHFISTMSAPTYTEKSPLRRHLSEQAGTSHGEGGRVQIRGQRCRRMTRL